MKFLFHETKKVRFECSCLQIALHLEFGMPEPTPKYNYKSK